MSLLTLRTAVVNTFTPLLAESKVKVEEHPGRFDIAELNRYATGAPAVRVAILTAKPSDDPFLTTHCKMAAYIITRADKQHRADAGALLIASALLPIVEGNQWNLDIASAAKNVDWQNLYGSEDSKRGTHLSAVTWTQPVSLQDGDGSATPEYPDLITFYSGWDLAAPDGELEAEDDITLETE